MNAPGEFELFVQTRSALLDAVDALGAHRAAVIVVGAQAVYLQTGHATVALAELTRDSDLAIDPRLLGEDPRIEQAMSSAGFTRHPDPSRRQPGAWFSPCGIEVDLMVPEQLAGAATGRSGRGARIPPHAKDAARRARGLEAALVDRAEMTVESLTAADPRRHTVRVAGPGALVVAKMHKIGERLTQQSDRQRDMDAHDVYWLLVATPTATTAAALRRALADEISAEVTNEAIAYLRVLFAAGPDAVGSAMAGRAEAGIGDPANVAASVAALGEDLLTELDRPAVQQ